MGKKCLFLLLAAFFGCFNIFAHESSRQLLYYIEKNLSHCGTLRDSDGFVYVDVDDRFIHDLIPFLKDLGFEKPPYFGREGLVGAHITVIYPQEMKEYGVGAIEEVGKRIVFTPLYCKIVSPPTWKEIDQLYLIVVDAPELDEIRKKYGLPKQRYDYHITIGTKVKVAKTG